MAEIILLNLTGTDRPGITRDLGAILARQPIDRPGALPAQLQGQATARRAGRLGGATVERNPATGARLASRPVLGRGGPPAARRQ